MCVPLIDALCCHSESGQSMVVVILIGLIDWAGFNVSTNTV